MRFSTIVTTLFATIAAAQPQEAYPAAGDSTMMQTFTMTRTVERVVETVTATRSSSYATVSPPLGTASAGIYPVSNGTSTVLGTGAGPSGGAAGAATGLPVSGAGKVGLEMLGLMAVAGVVGFAGL